MPSNAPVPVTLLTGFLGSGKTTLLNRLVRDPAAGRVAVVVNEFGELGIDGSLVVGSDEDVVELRNGCVCCTVRGDLARTLNRLLGRRRGLLRRLKFDRLAIELSGMASPGPVVQTLVVDDGLRDRTRLDGIVTLANAAQIEQQLPKHPEASGQVGYADLILLNHADRAEEEHLGRAEAALQGVNGLAPIVRTERSVVPIEDLLDLRTDAPERWRFVSPSGGGPSPSALAPEAEAHAHSPDVTTLSFESEAPLDLHKLKVWLQFVASRRDAELIRMKGILNCSGHATAVVAQAVYQWLEIGPSELERPATSRLVLIGRDLDRDALARGWALLR